jgi:pimeloyl-ACP methyl ester carboxylesterase
MPAHPTAPRRSLWSITVAAALMLAAAVIPSVRASANTTAAADGRSKPTIVLVHGSWADGSSWSAVVQRLHRKGYPVRVPPNPLRSLPGDAATIANFLATIPGPIVLVGHSYGGAVITNAATGNPSVKALVYVNAFAPNEGETVLPLAGPDSALAVPDPTTVFDFVPYPGAPAGDFDLYLKRSIFLTAFANGIPSDTASLLYATQRPITASAGNQPSGAPAWTTIPSWYLLGTEDKVIPADRQRFMARRAGARIVEVKAGHLSLVSRPGAVTDLIVKAVHQTTSTV